MLRVLSVAPSFYLQTAGLNTSNVRALEAAARAVVPALTGGRFRVTTFETGPGTRPEKAGWIVVDMMDGLDGGACGRAIVGASAGHIWLNTQQRCRTDDELIPEGTFSHEIGHALGFWHLDFPNALMYPYVGINPQKDPTEGERYHASVAYSRSAGNKDIDLDPDNVGPRSALGERPLVVD